MLPGQSTCYNAIVPLLFLHGNLARYPRTCRILSGKRPRSHSQLTETGPLQGQRNAPHGWQSHRAGNERPLSVLYGQRARGAQDSHGPEGSVLGVPRGAAGCWNACGPYRWELVQQRPHEPTLGNPKRELRRSSGARNSGSGHSRQHEQALGGSGAKAPCTGSLRRVHEGACGRVRRPSLQRAAAHARSHLEAPNRLTGLARPKGVI